MKSEKSSSKIETSEAYLKHVCYMKWACRFLFLSFLNWAIFDLWRNLLFAIVLCSSGNLTNSAELSIGQPWGEWCPIKSTPSDMMTKNNEVRKQNLSIKVVAGADLWNAISSFLSSSILPLCSSHVLPSGHAQFNIVKDQLINYSQTLTEMLPPSPHLFARLLSSAASDSSPFSALFCCSFPFFSHSTFLSHPPSFTSFCPPKHINTPLFLYALKCTM